MRLPNGEEIMTLGSVKQHAICNGNNGYEKIYWDELHKDIDVECTVNISKSDSDTEGIYKEKYKFSLRNLSENCVPNVYDVNKKISAAGGEYIIEQVRVYPLCTEVDVKYLNFNEVKTNIYR